MTRWVRAPVILIAAAALLLTTGAAPVAAPELSLPIVTGIAVLDHAERAAMMVLAANQQNETHRAAPFYRTPWMRDSYAWGMAPDDRGTLATYARGELRYWLRRQQSFGAWMTFPYSGWYDETPIMIAAVLDAYRQTGDRAMVRRAMPAVRRAWRWMRRSSTDRRHGSACLLWATVGARGPHWATDWADQVARQGYTPQLEGLWYQATRSLAALESLSGSSRAARDDARVATCIARDVNRLLWSVTAPTHNHAPAMPAFGHYHAPRGQRDYFEVDGNALLVAVGVAPPRRRDAVLDAIRARDRYLLGADGAGPARVVYGDYDPGDFASIHNWMGAGRYQNAYWPSVGGLLAMAAARGGDVRTAARVLVGLASHNSDQGSAFHEWYRADGAPGGARHYGWGARMYLLALYRAYLGVDDADDTNAPADLVLRAAPGPARGEITRLGLHVTIIGHGAGLFRYARLDGRVLRSSRVPARLLHDGAVLDIYRGTAGRSQAHRAGATRGRGHVLAGTLATRAIMPRPG